MRCFHGLILSALVIATLGQTVAAQCPTYNHTATITGARSEVPKGWYVFMKHGQNGIYKSDLRQFNPVMIPNTSNDEPHALDISPDGRWIAYASFKDDPNTEPVSVPYIIRVDGQFKTKMPISSININDDEFWPYWATFLRGGAEPQLLYANFMTELRVKPVTLPADGAPLFGDDRVIFEVPGFRSFFTDGGVAFWSHGTVQLAGDQAYGVWVVPVQGTAVMRSDFLTLPDGGASVANWSNMYPWVGDIPNPDDPDGSYYGCGQTMSHDGQYCVSNPGFVGKDLPGCLPGKYSSGPYGTMDHKGFMVQRFLRADETPIAWHDQVNAGVALSFNWCPEEFRVGDYEEVDFNDWYFGNRNDYVVGALVGRDLGKYGLNSSIYLIEWKTNTWTELTDPSNGVIYDEPAVFFTDVPDGIKLESGMDTGVHGSVSSAWYGAGQMLTLDAGVAEVSLYTVQGRLVWQYRRSSVHTREAVRPALNIPQGCSLIARYRNAGE